MSRILDFLTTQTTLGIEELEVLLVPTDNSALDGIRNIYESYRERLNIMLLELENRPSMFLPGYFGIFMSRHNPHFHDAVYDLTDQAIARCSHGRRWLLVVSSIRILHTSTYTQSPS